MPAVNVVPEQMSTVLGTFPVLHVPVLYVEGEASWMLEGKEKASVPDPGVTTTSPSWPVGRVAIGNDVAPVPMTICPAVNCVPISVL
jgi:hypothetical protein